MTPNKLVYGLIEAATVLTAINELLTVSTYQTGGT